MYMKRKTDEWLYKRKKVWCVPPTVFFRCVVYLPLSLKIFFLRENDSSEIFYRVFSFWAASSQSESVFLNRKLDPIVQLSLRRIKGPKMSFLLVGGRARASEWAHFKLFRKIYICSEVFLDIFATLCCRQFCSAAQRWKEIGLSKILAIIRDVALSDFTAHSDNCDC